MSNFPRLDETGLTRLVNKLAEQILPNRNVQSDWNESDNTSDAYIKNKPSAMTNAYSPDDSASTTINDTDYMPISESDGTTKKKALWTTIVAKIKTALGIESSGSTYLKKDGTWGTPTNTWKANSSSSEGYVASGANNIWRAWKTDKDGNPSWQNDVVILPTIDYQILPSQSNVDNVYFKEWIVYMCTNYPNEMTSHRPLLARVRPNSYGIVIGDLYTATDVDTTTGLPNYCSFTYFPLGTDATPLRFGTNAYKYFCLYIDKRKSFYGTCDTAAATAAKVVTLSNADGWELKVGTIVGINFTNTNTASSVTLNVNNSGAKSIAYAGAVFTGTNSSITGYAGRAIYYMYDGTYWRFLNNDWNYTNTTYPYYTKTIDADFATKFRTETKGDANSGNYIANIRTSTANIDGYPQYGAGLAFGQGDTHGYIVPSYTTTKQFWVGGGNADKLNWKDNLMLGWKSISRSGTTFTVTRFDGTTFTFTQQDNNTTYTFATGDSNGQIKVTPSGGSAQNVSVKGLGSRAYDSTEYVAKTGGTFTGGVTFTAGVTVQADATLSRQDGVAGTAKGNYLTIGNATPKADAKNAVGYLRLYSEGKNYVQLMANNSGDTATNATLNLPYNMNGKTVFTTGGGTLDGNLTINRQNGTTSSAGDSRITLGNNKNATTDKNSQGSLALYATDTHYYVLKGEAGSSADCTIYLPKNKGGKTLATQDQAINNITRSGTTFTATKADGSTFTFTQQDNNTTYSAGTGIALSSTTFSEKFAQENLTTKVTKNSGVSDVYDAKITVCGRIAILCVHFTTTANIANNTNILTFSLSVCTPGLYGTHDVVFTNTEANHTPSRAKLTASGKTLNIVSAGTFYAGDYQAGTFVFPCTPA